MPYCGNRSSQKLCLSRVEASELVLREAVSRQTSELVSTRRETSRLVLREASSELVLREASSELVKDRTCWMLVVS